MFVNIMDSREYAECSNYNWHGYEKEMVIDLLPTLTACAIGALLLFAPTVIYYYYINPVGSIFDENLEYCYDLKQIANFMSAKECMIYLNSHPDATGAEVIAYHEAEMVENLLSGDKRNYDSNDHNYKDTSFGNIYRQR